MKKEWREDGTIYYLSIHIVYYCDDVRCLSKAQKAKDNWLEKRDAICLYVWGKFIELSNSYL